MAAWTRAAGAAARLLSCSTCCVSLFKIVWLFVDCLVRVAVVWLACAACTVTQDFLILETSILTASVAVFCMMHFCLLWHGRRPSAPHCSWLVDACVFRRKEVLL